MFGYIRAYKSEMKMKDYEVYRSVYCSLCKELGKTFGPLARLTLSYDFTFLALLKISISDKCPSYKKSRCSFHPFKRCNNCLNDGGAIAFSATTAIIMLYYKLRDDIEDKNFWKKLPLLAIYPLVLIAHKKAALLQPEVEKIILKAMTEQKNIEDDRCDSIDAAAEPSARALSKIISLDVQDEAQRRVLERLGYCIGRYVYIIDAADDLKSDLKNSEYNPFIIHFNIKQHEQIFSNDVKEYIENILNMTMDEAIKAMELLDIKRYVDIIRNIIYDGFYNTMNEVLLSCPNKKEESYVEIK